MARRNPSPAVKEVAGVGLLAAAVLMFLSLVSYDVGDIPKWAPLISMTSSPNPQTKNLVGVVGALVGGYAYFFFGLAAFWCAALLAGLGIGRLARDDFSLAARGGWALVNMCCAACLAQMLPVFFGGWQDVFKAHGTGGFVGHYLGSRALRELLGPAGSLVGLVAGYLATLALATGLHPVHCMVGIWQSVRQWLIKRRAERLAKMGEAERLAEAQRELERRAEKLERKLRKGKSKAEGESLEPEATDSVPVTKAPGETRPDTEGQPVPKIIDASVPKVSKPAPTEGQLEVTGEQIFENYRLPGLELLDSHPEGGVEPADPRELLAIQNTIISTLAEFGIEASPGDITKGPTITRYEIYPASGVRVDRIVSLERDIARSTKAERINILAPIPGKDTVGIELANSKKVKVILRELFESDAWLHTKGKLPIALGKDVYGQTLIGDLAAMPHCLVAGTTGSGKSVCINAMIASLLYRHSPEDLRFIMIDPKVVELQMFNKLPHLVTPVVTDPKKVLLALRWVIEEMELRYKIFAKVGVRNISGFNTRKKNTSLDQPTPRLPSPSSDPEEQNGCAGPTGGGLAPETGDASSEAAASVSPVRVPREDDLIIPEKMPYIVVIVDELADLMQTAPADVEGAIARITQMARAAGIHMIVATQTPRADVVTGIIKANIPTRIAFQVASKIDSRVILDENGAEKLLGQGDMLYLPPGTSKLTRAQGVLVTDEEMRRIVDFAAHQAEPAFDPAIEEKLNEGSISEDEITEEDEELVARCLEIIKQERKASTSMLQRRLRLGYTRAARVVDILEQRGILGPKDGSKDREILVDLDSL